MGKNDKTKIVIKLAIIGSGEKAQSVLCVLRPSQYAILGPPVREPGMNEEERKHLMLMEHRRREEIKRLLQDEDDNYLNQVLINKCHELTSPIYVLCFRTGLMVIN